jgi:hypothetical protein
MSFSTRTLLRAVSLKLISICFYRNIVGVRVQHDMEGYAGWCLNSVRMFGFPGLMRFSCLDHSENFAN